MGEHTAAVAIEAVPGEAVNLGDLKTEKPPSGADPAASEPRPASPLHQKNYNRRTAPKGPRPSPYQPTEQLFGAVDTFHGGGSNPLEKEGAD